MALITETLDKAYLEYSNITTAITAKELLLIDKVKQLESNLTKAVQYLKEGKRLYTPNTTNSLVDEFLKDMEGEK